MCPVSIIIVVVNYLIRIEGSNNQDVACLVLRGAWQVNLWHSIIASEPCEMLGGGCNFPQPGFVRIGAIHLIPQAMEVVSPLFV
jgi:hypothetical protein